MNADPAESSPADFLRRALRWLAILCLVYAVISLASVVIAIPVQGWMRYSWNYGSRAWRGAEMFTRICSILAMLSLLVGAYGLLRWRRWSRLVLLISASALLITSFASQVLWLFVFIEQINQSRASTRTYYQPPAWFYVTTTLTQWLVFSLFPLVVVWTMLQLEVAELWARRGASGFEVLPLAKAVEGNPP